MYKEHKDFQPAPPSAVLWRYMDFTKFISLLDKEALFFARVDKLGDPFEGSFSRGNIDIRPEVYGEKYENLKGSAELKAIFKGMRKIMGISLKGKRKEYLISCWHEKPHESAAMWRLYSREHDGIAIKSNFQSFTESFRCNEDVYVGRIKYIDYQKDSIPDNSMVPFFLHKRKSFEHECELRALIPNHSSNKKEGKLSKTIDDIGTYYKVDVSSLIQEVIVAPYAQDWFLKLVTSTVCRYGLKAPVKKSALASEPFWY